MSKMLRKHVFKLIFRTLLLIFTIVLQADFTQPFEYLQNTIFIGIIWLMLVSEMLMRLIPNKQIALGARKHFASSFIPTSPLPRFASLHKGAFLSAFGWFAITTSIVFALHHGGHLSPVSVLILMLIYSLVDLVFIIFFCPFRKLFMKNFCCQTCRIYNWDYFMMCAPLLLFPSVFSLTLVGLAAAIVLCWEWNIIKNPRRFIRETNGALRCNVCTDKLCGLTKKAASVKDGDRK